jgi:hypothetical protein
VEFRKGLGIRLRLHTQTTNSGGSCEHRSKKIFWFPRKDFQFWLGRGFPLVTVGNAKKP